MANQSESPQSPESSLAAAQAPTLLPSSNLAEAPTLVPPSAAEAPTLLPPAGQAGRIPADAGENQGMPVDLAAGILGPYRELQPVRAWKFGTIYSAVHPKLRRRVLLRVLAPEYGATPLQEEFQRTARAVAAIKHPNVESGIFEAGVYGNVAFFAQELTELEPLGGFLPRDRQQQLKEGLYPNTKLAQAILEAALGLQAIHDAGLVHGQLTSDSVRRTNNGQIRLSGLGEEVSKDEPGNLPGASVTEIALQRDVRDLASAFGKLVTGSQPDLSKPLHHRTLLRHLRTQNPELSRPIADVLAR